MAPTDEELLELMPQGFRDDLALVSRMAAHGAGPEVQPGLFRVTLNTGALDYARAVWDHARAADLLEQRHPAPVPVSERLPGPEDCDADGNCWWYDSDWFWDDRQPMGTTHWLPAHALPLPAGEVK